MTTLTLVPTTTDPDWWDQAACLGMDPDDFFPDHGRVVTPDAKAACAGCPVRMECLQAAIEEEVAAATLADAGAVSFYVHGYRGGTTRAERIAIHHERQDRRR